MVVVCVVVAMLSGYDPMVVRNVGLERISVVDLRMV